MPIYAYKCAECGHSMEVIQKVSDSLLTDCPNCGKPALVKQVTAAGFQLKGGGWYVTDFRDSGKKKGAGKSDEKVKTEEVSDSKSATTSDVAADAKTSAKSEPKIESKPDADKPAPAPASTPKPKPGASSDSTS